MARYKVVLAGIAIAVGGLLYVLFRTRHTLLLYITDGLGLSSLTDSWRNMLGTSAIAAMPEWVVYNLPGGLWSAAYVLLVDALKASSSLRARLLTAAFIPLAGVVSEVMQMVHWLPGTADPMDMVAYALPYLIYMCSLYYYEQKKRI